MVSLNRCMLSITFSQILVNVYSNLYRDIEDLPEGSFREYMEPFEMTCFVFFRLGFGSSCSSSLTLSPITNQRKTKVYSTLKGSFEGF